MPERELTVGLFAEDVAHESFLRAAVRRIALEEGLRANVDTVVARGGHGRVTAELGVYQRSDRPGMADAVVVAIDANCGGWNVARQAIDAAIDRARCVRPVIACPDPHVERWYLADPQALAEVLGVHVAPEPGKCERDRYKRLLVHALAAAGHVLTLGGVEFADEIVAGMDFYRAGKNEPSLKHFVAALRAALRDASQR